MKAIITGSQGFVGRYLRQELQNNDYEVIGLDLAPGPDTIEGDLLDGDRFSTIVDRVRPDAVFHLAGQADVGASWRIPRKTFELNVIATINLLEAVRTYDPSTRVVLVGSSDQYGNLGEAGRLVNESFELHPQTPYAVSKKTQEEIATVYAHAYGMNLCMTRSFNHYGPGQREGFLISDFAAGIVRIEQSLAPCLKVGNLDSRRDFTHVRDVVRAYRLIAEKGGLGETYNIGSGVTYSAGEILNELLLLAKCPISVKKDPARSRPSDTPVICCDHSKLTEATGWQPQLSLKQGLDEVLNDWRDKLKRQTS